jgi:hypothetical protein
MILEFIENVISIFLYIKRLAGIMFNCGSDVFLQFTKLTTKEFGKHVRYKLVGDGDIMHVLLKLRHED